MPHDAYFQGNPTRLDVSRSKMHGQPRWSGSWNVGKLFPIFATSSIMPGDTFKMSVSSAIRMVRPVVPVMDDMEITIEAFFVPHRLVMSRKTMSPDLNDSNHSWSAFIGAQDSLLNMPTPGDVMLPSVYIEPSSYLTGGVADCLGLHKPATTGYYVNPLKVMAFYSVWNEFFREPNTMNPVTYEIVAANNWKGGAYVNFYGSDANINVASGDPAYYRAYVGRFPLPPVCRYHGYFGSALPWPQRNSASVSMPLGDSAPVFTADYPHDSADLADKETLKWAVKGTGTPITSSGNLVATSTGSPGVTGTNTESFTAGATVATVVPSNLYADLSEATAASVNQFRLAVQTQRWYEQLARSGNKYSDLVNGMFGVRGPSIPDRPEYLGGFTAPINMSQVNGTSGNDLGATGAFSLSNPGGYLFTKSFTEHGTLIVVACCRVRESFSQGVKKEDCRFERFDFYWPSFANIGEEPLLKKYLYAGTSADDDVFGYQEAWAEYRQFSDDVCGFLNKGATGNIGAYTYANYFSSAPTLAGYLNAESQVTNVDDTLTAKSSATGFQLFGQFMFDIDMVRPMPLYSIPGLVDHH